MRLTEFEVDAIKECIYQFDPDAKIILFGSRVDDTKKGGDIDLLVLSEKITKSERRRIKINLYDRIKEKVPGKNVQKLFLYKKSIFM